MVTVVIPVFNQSHHTERCLQSLLENSTELLQVCIIDNGSVDQTQSVLKKFHLLFTHAGIDFIEIVNEKNVGFGRACNQGIRQATAEFVAVLNNDTWVMPGWDQALRNALEEKKLSVVGPYFDEKPFTENMCERAQAFTLKNRGKTRAHFVPILMFFSRAAIDQIKFDHGGIFDERFFVTYEDTDLRHRMDLTQMRYAQTADCYLWHHSMGTRSAPGALPKGYELEGLKLFTEKWGFDPRPKDHTFGAKLKRKYWKWKEARGSF